MVGKGNAAGEESAEIVCDGALSAHRNQNVVKFGLKVNIILRSNIIIIKLFSPGPLLPTVLINLLRLLYVFPFFK